MKYTAYFEWRVLLERPYIRPEWCVETVRVPETVEVQPDGRVRFWRFVPELGRHLRVVTLADRETLHNAFPDRSFKPPGIR